MGLPLQEEKNAHIEDEIERIVAQRMAAIQLDQLSARVARDEAKNAEIFSEIRSSLKSLDASAVTGMNQLYQCRQALRDEIEQEFVTKTVFNVEMKRLEEMVLGQWKTITVAVSVAVLTIQFVFQFWSK